MYIGLLQPQCERVAIEALQLCTLLLPPASRRKLQLLMRMMSRISQNVDMPRLHPAIGTRTLVGNKTDVIWNFESTGIFVPLLHLITSRGLMTFHPHLSFPLCINHCVCLGVYLPVSLSLALFFCGSPSDGSHVFRLCPGQRCGV